MGQPSVPLIPQKMPIPKKRLASLAKAAATILIIALTVYYFLHNVDFSELADSFRAANYWIALSVIPVILVSHYVRAHRWKIMLERIHPDVRIWNLFIGVIFGYVMNNLIPRSGEFVRPWVTADRERESGAKFSSLLGTIIVERFIDTVALLLVIAVVLVFDTALFAGFEGLDAAVRNMLYPTIAIGVLFILIAPSTLGLRLARIASKPLPAGLREKVLDIFIKLQRGFGAIRTWRQAAWVLSDTILMYFLYMLPLFIMFFAIDSGAGASPKLFDAVEVFAITALAYAVAPTPGAFGVFHVTARVAVMQLLAFTYADAVAYATIMHFINYSTVMAVGLVFLFLLNISFRDVWRKRTDDDTR